jgi:Tfp pilus assembly protein PilF
VTSRAGERRAPDGGSRGAAWRTRQALVLASLLLVIGAAAALALGQGRVFGTVVDASGAPVAGVKVTVTSPEMATFRLEKATDARGQFSAIILDAVRQYRIRFEKAGYETLEEPLKPKVEDTLKATYTLQPQQAPAAETGAAQGAGTALPGTSASGPGAGAGSPAGTGPSGTGGQSGAEVKTRNEAITAYNDGVTALKAKDVPGAITKFERAAAIDPKLAAAQAVLADLYLDQKRPADALAAAERALALEPGKARVQLVRYQALRALGDRARAAQALDALAEHPAPDVARDVAVYLYNDAADATRDKNPDLARSNLRRALAADPTLEPAYGALARLDMAQNDDAGALAVADRWVAAVPHSLQALQMRYELLSRLKDPRAKEARATMESAKAGAGTPLNQGIDLYNANRIPEATKVFEGVVTAEPGNAKAHYLLALCYTNAGNLVAAREQLETYLRLAPAGAEAETARQMLKELR